MTTYTWEDFGLDKNGPQFAVLDERLTLWGHPSNSLLDTPKDRVYRWQRSIGNRPDGLLGPKQWALLQTDPPTAPAPTPSNVIELSKFKRTLPTGEPGHPTEVYPLTDTTEPVTFRAPVNGVHTENTKYTRDELREMHPKSWSASDGKHHKLTGICRVTEIPGQLDDDYTTAAAFAQLHGDEDDIVILLADIEGRVIVEEGLGPGNGSDKYELFTGYRLGDQLSYVIDAHKDGIDVTVNGHHVRIDKVAEDAYAKAGVYNRGNKSNATGAGSVEYELLKVSHA